MGAVVNVNCSHFYTNALILMLAIGG